MTEDSSKYSEILTIFLCFILALLGGTAKELAKVEDTFSWQKFFRNVFVAGFSGLIISLFAPDFEHKNWVIAFSGIAGFSGTVFLDFAFEVLKETIRKLANTDYKG